jgi:hypothetical protein
LTTGIGGVRLHKEAMAEEAVVVEREVSPCFSAASFLLSLGLLLLADCGLTCCISCQQLTNLPNTVVLMVTKGFGRLAAISTLLSFVQINDPPNWVGLYAVFLWMVWL